MNYITEAKKIIREKFKYKTDRAGIPYLYHLYHVADEIKKIYPNDDELYVIALLHDLLEDIDSWNENRLAKYFSSRIVRAVSSLTKKKGEKYNRE